MESVKYIKVTWKCATCESIQESYSNVRWNMDRCKCGDSGYDLEEFYARIIGNVVELKREELYY
jgi:hypothetical protein